MSVEQALAQATECIDELLLKIETAYQNGAPEYEIDFLFRHLESSYQFRDALRRRYVGNDLSPHLDIVATLECHATTPGAATEELRAAFEEFGEKLVELAKAWVNKGVGHRPKWPYALARVVGPIKREHFMLAQPATRKPIYPGYMRAKGRG